MLLLSSGKKVFNFLDFFGSEVSKNINFLDFFTRNIYSWNPLNVKNSNILTLANVFVNKKQMGTVYNTYTNYANVLSSNWLFWRQTFLWVQKCKPLAVIWK